MHVLNIDPDVMAERQVVDDIIKSTDEPTDALVVDHLRKVYTSSTGFLFNRQTKSHAAVQDICLRVKRGECFGIVFI